MNIYGRSSSAKKNDGICLEHVRMCLLSLSFAASLFCVQAVHAQTTDAVSGDDLQNKIDQRNRDIQALQVEIKSYQSQLDTLGGQETSLSSTLKSLDLTQKKLQADLKVSENKIAEKTLEIRQLDANISGKQSNISEDQRIVTQSFQSLNESGNRSLPELLLDSASVSDAFRALDQLGTLQQGLYGRIGSLQNDAAHLNDNKAASLRDKADLVTLNSQLKDQRAVVLSTSAEKTALLNQTKQSEASYQKMLADKQTQEAAFQQEISDYESQLHLKVDSSAIPRSSSGVLSWPIDNVFITQYFGNTPFSTANPQIYNGKGHTGVDFRAPIGTPIKAALDGVVVGVANMDLVPGCYSYGKWIMLKHPNGLSTLYAHLSVQSVSDGDVVAAGQIIGYSGNTGYTTGPHLHFGVYATQGVVIKSFDNSLHCKGALIPLADYKAYLNPLSFLPAQNQQ